MPTFKYAKLVRDNIPGWHRQNGHVVNGRRLEGNELRDALIEKLHEEADEVGGALNRNELIEEIGDIQQIIYDLCKLQDISDEELELSIKRKSERKGGFEHGEYIDTLTIPDENDKWARYCRASPKQYPEINDV